MSHVSTAPASARRAGWRGRAFVWITTLVIVVAATSIHAEKSTRESPDQLSIQVNDDRMTLAFTRVPQVYLYGVIDAGAPQRLQALMQSFKVPAGSDIYLNATGNDTKAGMALGRLLRQGHMITHLGTPRPPKHSGAAGKPASCSGACAYAYLGGVYRWAPSGNDHIGFPVYAAGQAPQDVLDYWKEMGVRPETLTAPVGSKDPEWWPGADQMIASGLANNGRQNLTASYKLLNGAPYLELKQTDRKGDHTITLLCKAGGAVLTTYDTMSVDHARMIASQAASSYFEIDQQQMLPQQADGVSVVDNAVVITRTYPLAQLSSVANAKAMGAWVVERGMALRYGFSFEVSGVHNVLHAFYSNCRIYAPVPGQAP